MASAYGHQRARPQRKEERARERPQVRAGRHPRNGEPVHQPAAAYARRGDGAGDQRSRAKREAGLAAVGLDNAGGLAHHRQARRGGEEKHAKQQQENPPLRPLLARHGRRVVVHADPGDSQQRRRHSLETAMPPGLNGTTSALENCRSVAVATGRRSPMPLPLMQANILSPTK